MTNNNPGSAARCVTGQHHPKSELELELIRWAQHGVRGAFDELVAPHRGRLLRSIMKIVHNLEDSEDVLQETFLRAYRAIANFRGDSTFYTWLFRIATNAAMAFVTSRLHLNDMRTVSVDSGDCTDVAELNSDNVTPQDILEAKQLADVVLHVVERLPEDHCTAITMYEVGGLSYREIADAMVCPIGTVRSRIANARSVIGISIAPAGRHS